MERKTMLEALKKEKIIAIVRGLSAQTSVAVAKALYAGGIRFIEVTFDQSRNDAVTVTGDSIRAISGLYPDLYVGAGTVMTQQQLDAAYAAGARYMISPNVDAELIRSAVSLGMAAFPGAMTPTEIALAYHAGATCVKLFPAGTLGTAYIKAIRAPLNQIPLLAVGGVDKDNMQQLYDAGIVGFGIGSNIVDKKLVAQGDFAGLSALAAEYVRAAEALGA